ncbi:SEC14-like protein 2 [Orchesella cincta]|uniref:SEC14-like protein 2 n=1 Tax=Orchesella cincta TaxID=48709 RepID=A0A1D2NFF8_ORCCI|nr:SEC14-like protein 2 [Orchesella cincta]
MGQEQIGRTLLIIGLIVIGEWSHLVQSVTTEQDLTLTAKEKRALDQLKERVAPIVPHEYMKQDIYLIRWLRARNLDVNQAETMLLENLKWRKENRMDNILNEDFSELDRDYPFQIQYEDKEGKPIVTANFGDWDIRKLAISGKISSLNRHIDRGFEMVTDKVRKLQESGKVVAQWDFIINMENYKLSTAGLLTMSSYVPVSVNTYENHFPAHADKIMLINTPAIFELVLNIIRPIMSPLTRQTLKVYNTNKEQWQKELFEIVDRNELPPEYGGTREV